MDTGLIGQPRLPRRETYLDGTPESSVPGLEQPPGNHDQEIVKRLEAGNVNQGLAAQFRLQHGSHESRFSTAAGAKQKQGFPVLDGDLDREASGSGKREPRARRAIQTPARISREPFFHCRRGQAEAGIPCAGWRSTEPAAHAANQLPAIRNPCDSSSPGNRSSAFQKGSVGSPSGSIRGAIGGNFTESSYGYPP